MMHRTLHYVVLGSQRSDIAQSVRAFSRLTQLEEPKARSLLSTRGPRLFRAYHRQSEAEGLTGQLHALGLRATLVDPKDILEYRFLHGRQINVGLEGINALIDEREDPYFLPFSEIVAVVEGAISELDLPSESHGREDDQPIAPQAITIPYVDIHRQAAHEALRIRKPDLQIDPVPPESPMRHPSDFERFVQWVCRHAPKALYDNAFNRSTDAVRDSLHLLDAGEKAAFESGLLEEENLSGESVALPQTNLTLSELSGRPAFDLYSSLLRYQATEHHRERTQSVQ